MRGRVSGEWERGCVRDRRPVMWCPSYVGSCVSVHTRSAVFSLNSNIKTAQVSPSLPLRQLSAAHHKCTMDCTSNQCPDQGPVQTCFSINMYILVLTPLLLPSRPSFFLSLLLIQGQCFFFPSPAPPEASFCWSVESLHSVFKWSVKISILYFPESSFPSLSSSLCACPFLLHSSLPHLFTSVFMLLFSSSCPWSLFILLLLQPSTFTRACSLSLY